MKKYVEAQYDEESQRMLRQWCQETGFDLTYKWSGRRIEPEQFDFHTTIMYSINDSDIETGAEKLTTRVEVYPVGFKVLDEYIPTLIVESAGLDVLHNVYKFLGLQHSFSDYLPHISISYKRDENYDDKVFELPKFPIYFDKINITNVV